jgi:plastocyanin
MTPTNTIIMRDNVFQPAQLTIGVGRSIIWRNQGSIGHTATSGTPASNPGSLFDSGIVPPGGGFMFTISQPGTYVYFCRVHGTAMSGTLVVQ